MTSIASRRDFPRDDRWTENEFSTFYSWKLVKQQDECKRGKISDIDLKARRIRMLCSEIEPKVVEFV